MATANKTQPTDASFEEFLNAIEEPQKRADCLAIDGLMRRITGEEPILWGSSIVGYGRYRYVYESGRSGESPLAGFSPRKQNIVIYITAGFDRYEELLGRLGKHKIGKSCLYLKRLSDLDLTVLEDLVRLSFEHMRATNQAA